MINVLIVEDDPMVIEITKSLIQETEGYTVVQTCRDGIAALEFLESSEIDLIMVDISMPKMDGLTFVKELRKNQKNSDVIFVTAFKDTKTIQTALKYGAVDYIVKPYEYERFSKTMISYKKRFETLQHSGSFEQDDIDKITNRFKVKSQKELPKGIHYSTLDKVLKALEKIDNKTEFSIEDFSRIIHMSNVSLRLYLDYLCKEDIIISDTKYGTVGRPKYIYRKIKN